MSKKDFIALADFIRTYNGTKFNGAHFTRRQVEAIAQFCANQNPRFKRERWLSYIAGECGKNGGAR